MPSSSWRAVGYRAANPFVAFSVDATAENDLVPMRLRQLSPIAISLLASGLTVWVFVSCGWRG